MSISCNITPMVFDKNGNEVESTLYNDIRLIMGSVDKKNGGRDKCLPPYKRTLGDKFKQAISKYNVSYDSNGEITLKSLIENTDFGNNITEEMKLAFFKEKYFNKNSEVSIKNPQSINDIVKNIIEFNKSEWGSDYIASTIKSKDDNITVDFQPISNNNKENSKDIQFYYELSNRLKSILEEWGIAVTELNDVESKNTNGFVDFSSSAKTADGLLQLIYLAKGMHGVKALPEEMSHLVLRSLRSSPIISRLKALYKDNNLYIRVLGDKYSYYNDLYKGDVDMLVEEALGQALAKHIIKEAKIPGDSLFRRLFVLIKMFFSNFSSDKINNALREADKGLNVLAKQILKNNLKNIDISNLGNDKLYSYNINHEIEKSTLESLHENTIRMHNLYKKRMAEFRGDIAKQKQSVVELQEISLASLTEAIEKKNPASKLNAVIDCLAEATKDLFRIQKIIEEIHSVDENGNVVKSSLPFNIQANKMLQIRDYLKFYEDFVHEINIIGNNDKELFEFLDWTTETEDKYGISRDQIKEIFNPSSEKDNMSQKMINVFQPLRPVGSDESTRSNFDPVQYMPSSMLWTNIAVLKARWEKTAYDVFKDAFNKFIPEGAYVMVTDGSILPVRRLFKDSIEDDISTLDTFLHQGKDISWFSSMLSSAASCPDEFIKLYDSIIKRQKDYADEEMYEVQRKIIDAGIKYKDATGKATHEFMYTKDSNGRYKNRYINKWNDEEFQKDVKKKKDYLNKILDGERAAEELYKWIDENTEYLPNSKIRKPKDPKYYSEDYLALSKPQKAFYDEFIVLKAQMDSKLPFPAERLFSPIYIKKSFFEAVFHNLESKNIFKNFINWIKTQPSMLNDYLKWKRSGSREMAAEEIDEYGQQSSSVDFFNKEVKNVPIYYNQMNKDGVLEDYSIDLVTNMTMYSHMATRYHALNQVRNIMELGKVVLAERKFDTGKSEKFKNAKKVIRKFITEDPESTDFMNKIDKFLDMQMYGNLKERKLSRLANAWSTYVSLGTTAISIYTAIVNVFQGFHQINMELFAGEYFTLGDFLKGQAIYYKYLFSTIFENHKLNKRSKLSLFSQEFNIMQERRNELYDTNFLMNSSAKTRWLNLLNQSTLYMLTNGGEHLMQHASALAISQHDYLINIRTGKRTSIFDAYNTQTVNGSDLSKQEIDYMKNDKVENIEDIDTLNDKKKCKQLVMNDIYMTQKGEIVIPKSIVKQAMKNLNILNINYLNDKLLGECIKILKEKYPDIDFDKIVNDNVNNIVSEKYKGRVEQGEYKAKFITEHEYKHKVSRKMAKVNNDIHGIYNEDDRNSLQYYSLGRLAIMYRKHIIPGVLRRWKQSGYDYMLDNYTEGFSLSNLRAIRSMCSGERYHYNDDNIKFTKKDQEYQRINGLIRKWYDVYAVGNKNDWDSAHTKLMTSQEYKDLFDDSSIDTVDKARERIISLDKANNFKYSDRSVNGLKSVIKFRELQMSNNIQDQRLLMHYMANIYRAFGNMFTFILNILMVNIISSDDDDDEWINSILSICLIRTMHETAFFTPISLFSNYNTIEDWLRVFSNPIIGMNKINDLSNLIQLMTPEPWIKEMESGPFKGKKEAFSIIWKSLPFVRQIDQLFNPNESLANK